MPRTPHLMLPQGTAGRPRGAAEPAGKRRAAAGGLQRQRAGFSPESLHIIKWDFICIDELNKCKCNPRASRQEELNLPESF